MKIAVLSDTHGNYPLAVRVLDRIPDLSGIIHLGDNTCDAAVVEAALSRPVIKVAGNCDAAAEGARELLLNIGETNLFLTHGDLYNVKCGIDRLILRVARENVAIALYGHTHIPSIQERDNILFVNPGCLRKAADCQTIALLSIANGAVSADIVPVSGM